MRQEPNTPAEGSRRCRRSNITRRAQWCPLLAALLAAAYLTGRFLPGLDRGAHLAVRWYGAIAIYAVAAAIVLARARLVERDRRAWTILGVGMVLYALGVPASLISPRAADDPPALAFVCWIGFYGALYASLLTLLRSRLRPFTLAFCLDGALARADARRDLLRAGPPRPPAPQPGQGGRRADDACMQLMLLSLLVWASAMTGWRGGETWRWLAAAMVLAAGAEISTDISIARDRFDELAPLTALYPPALLCLAVAAWRPSPAPRTMRTDPISVLALPAISFAAVIGVLLLGDAEDTLTGGLVIGALAIAATRAGLTVRDLSRLHEARRFARGFDEAAIGMAFVSPRDLTWTRVNQTLADMLGRTPEDIVGRFIGEVTHPDDRDNAGPIWDAYRAGAATAAAVRAAGRQGRRVGDRPADQRRDGRGRRRLAAAVQPAARTSPRRGAPRATTRRWPS